MRSVSLYRDSVVAQMGMGPNAGPEPLIRDSLEASRLAWRKLPEAEYPDGYLSTATTTRRADKISNAIWRNQKSYNRGIHKGSRVDMSDYLWPEEFGLESGVVNQATTGLRYSSPAYGVEPVQLTNDGRPGPRDVAGMDGRPNTGVPVIPDPQRAAQLGRMRPPWR
jgi:hypothetical protein